jgi:methylglutaconyl-CoA hydratase
MTNSAGSNAHSHPDVSSEVSKEVSSAAGTLQVQVAEGIASIDFQTPKGNSLPGSMLAGLAQQITTLGQQPDVRVIVLRSGGTGPFCAGASFDELIAIEDEAGGREFFSGFSRVILAMIRAPKFVLTRVHGKAAGGAVGLIAASDFSFAVRSASAKLSELAIGIGPFVVGPVIEKKIGLAAYGAMAVDADWRDATWCERHGLYARLFDTVDEMDGSLDALARTLAASNPDAMSALKRVFWTGTEQWDSLLAERAGMSGRMVLSDFTRNAIGNFRAR